MGAWTAVAATLLLSCLSMSAFPLRVSSLRRMHTHFRSRNAGVTAMGETLRRFSQAPVAFSPTSVDTIYALSSGNHGRSGVAVVRVSGPAAMDCLQSLSCKDKAFSAPAPRMASLRQIYSPQTQELLDKALVLWFPSPNSFTGEDVVELHVHGSRAVLSGLFEAFASMDSSGSLSIRPAEPGEFTRRAFENGKMDLTEVEGLADLLAADTAQQRKQALKQMDGHLRRAFERWREVLIKCLAHTEAVIDFGDDDREGDIDDSALQALLPAVVALRQELELHLQDNRKGEIIRDGIQVALCGPPNAGKSSLMNYLARRPAAIVSPIAGTTRDVVEVRMDIGGYPCIVRDTAGLRANSSDTIELEGMQRAREAYESAHIKVFVADASDAQSLQESATIFSELLRALPDSRPSEYLFVLNKADLVPMGSALPVPWETALRSSPSRPVIHSHTISCATGMGLDALESGLSRSLLAYLNVPATAHSAPGDESVLITRERHRRHVLKCVDHLDHFLYHQLPMDAAAEELRLAMVELGKVTGRVDVEELLDVIFRDFCIGK